MQILSWRAPTLANNISLFISTVSASLLGSQKCSEQDWIMQETLSHTTSSPKELQVERQKNSLTHLNTTIAALHGGQASRKICRGKENEKVGNYNGSNTFHCECGCRRRTDWWNRFMNTITNWELLMKNCFQVQTRKQSCGDQTRNKWMTVRMWKQNGSGLSAAWFPTGLSAETIIHWLLLGQRGGEIINGV